MLDSTFGVARWPLMILASCKSNARHKQPDADIDKLTMWHTFMLGLSFSLHSLVPGSGFFFLSSKMLNFFIIAFQFVSPLSDFHKYFHFWACYLILVIYPNQPLSSHFPCSCSLSPLPHLPFYFPKAVFTPQVWNQNGSGTVPVARVQTCSTAFTRSGTSRPPRDVIAVERFRNRSGTVPVGSVVWTVNWTRSGTRPVSEVASGVWSAHAWPLT